MLGIVLQILSVLGIILLVLLGLLLAVVLLVLFFPVTYHISGRKEEKHLEAAARASWLFGLLRVRFAYPEPGKITAKFLWHTIYEMPLQPPADKPSSEEGGKSAPAEPSSQTAWVEPERPEGEKTQSKAKKAQSGTVEEKKPQDKEKTAQSKTAKKEKPRDKEDTAPSGTAEAEMPQGKGEQKREADSWFSEKIAKIKYTIHSTYDKIKKIWQNISSYMELLRAEDTRLLFGHVNSGLFKILKSLRPRKLKAQVLFGTGSPDTTGYAYGIYGMLQPMLGSEVIVTPDFQEARLEGSFTAVGYITSVVLLWHFLRVLLDRRLWRFWTGLKKILKPAKSAG